MTEIERFQAALETSPALANGLAASTSLAGLVAHVNSNGFAVTADDLAAWSRSGVDGELSSAELDGITGGKSAIYYILLARNAVMNLITP